MKIRTRIIGAVALIIIVFAIRSFVIWGGKGYYGCALSDEAAMGLAEQYLKEHRPELMQYVKPWRNGNRYASLYESPKNIHRILPDANAENTLRLFSVSMGDGKNEMRFEFGCNSGNLHGFTLPVLNNDGSIRKTSVISQAEAVGIINDLAGTVTIHEGFGFEGIFKYLRGNGLGGRQWVDWQASYPRMHGGYADINDAYSFEITHKYHGGPRIKYTYKSGGEKAEGTVRLSKEEAFIKAEQHRVMLLRQEDRYIHNELIISDFPTHRPWINIPEETVIRAVPIERLISSTRRWKKYGYTSMKKRLAWVFYYRLPLNDRDWQAIAVDAENGDLVSVFGESSDHPRMSKNARVGQVKNK